MWSPLLTPGLGLLDGSAYEVRALSQALTHFVIHAGPTAVGPRLGGDEPAPACGEREGAVLWCDGDHGFNPYDFAELNLVNGHDAAHGSERVLVKRCMTPFQWDTVLTKHLPAKLESMPTGLALAVPYDRLFSTDELQPWEQIDYVAYSLELLRDLAREHQVPILLGSDIRRWSITHRHLARMTLEGVEKRWALGRRTDGAIEVASVAREMDARHGRQTTLDTFAREEPPRKAELRPMTVRR